MSCPRRDLLKLVQTEKILGHGRARRKGAAILHSLSRKATGLTDCRGTPNETPRQAGRFSDSLAAGFSHQNTVHTHAKSVVGSDAKRHTLFESENELLLFSGLLPAPGGASGNSIGREHAGDAGFRLPEQRRQH